MTKHRLARRLLLSIAVAALLAVPAAAADLFSDDFSSLPPGLLSAPMGQLNGAIQEYHFIRHRGVDVRPWYNPIVHLDSWVVGDEDGKSYLEQHMLMEERFRNLLYPLFVTGDEEWGDYTVEAKVRPLSFAKMAGVVFRYHTNRHYYLFALRGGNKAVLTIRGPLESAFRQAEWRVLGEVPFNYDTKRYYALTVENDGPKIRCLIDGKPVLEASDGELLRGRVGVMANIPARFTDFRVSVSDEAHRGIVRRIDERELELAWLRRSNPQPKLWKRFKTPIFGAGRNVRFGDLDGDGQIDMLIAQNIPKVRGDAFDHISSLTAVNLDGKILWQIGRPDPRNGLLTNDTPFQIHDIDGDGRNEVVLAKDYKLQILDGRTGQVKKWAWMPEAPKSNTERPYELNNGDSIAFFDFEGKGRRSNTLLKDRYRALWIFNENLEIIGTGAGQTGHYPFPYDFTGDGKDELVIGFSVRDGKGQPIWSKDDFLLDHTDAISAGNYTGDPSAPPRIYSCGSDEGFLVFSKDGEILKHQRIGHVQTQSVGQFRPETPALEIMVANFWRNTGIVTLLDPDGEILLQKELVPGSSHLKPVNWRGDGTEFAMLHGNAADGGLVDGQLRRVVMFPDDGHPDLAYAVMDLTGDARDEIILWDQEEVWIYTQDRPFEGDKIYAPKRNPTYNDSNYRSTVSLPAWQDHPRR
jgi:rhamnogalacturonan endolyase